VTAITEDEYFVLLHGSPDPRTESQTALPTFLQYSANFFAVAYFCNYSAVYEITD